MCGPSDAAQATTRCQYSKLCSGSSYGTIFQKLDSSPRLEIANSPTTERLDDRQNARSVVQYMMSCTV
jgi:hypothetical protein